MITLLALALTTPPTAHAGYAADELKEAVEGSKIIWPTGLDKFYDHTGAAELGGVIELPMYSLLANDPRPYIQVETPDGELHLLQIDVFGKEVWLNEAFVTAAGGKAKERKLGGEYKRKVAKIDGFSADQVTFGEMHVFVMEGSSELGVSGPVPVAGRLGLASFPDLAAAVLNSSGVVRLAPAAQAGELLAAVPNGAKLTYTLSETQVLENGSKNMLTNAGMIVPGELDGQQVNVVLSSWKQGAYGPTGSTHIQRSAVGDRQAFTQSGVLKSYSGALALGSFPVFDIAMQETSHAGYFDWSWDLSLSSSVSAQWDVAYDPISSLVVIADASELKRKPWSDHVLAETLKGLEPNEETGEPPEADAVAGVNAKLVGMYSSLRKQDDAIKAAEVVAEHKPEECAGHNTLGQTYLAFGEYEAAKPHLAKAAELYAPWAELPLEERSDLQEEKAKAEKKDEAYMGPIPQSHACSTAWGDIAEIEVALGNNSAAQKIYREHLDLDSDVALYGGVAYFLDGKLGDANEAFRQLRTLTNNKAGNGAIGAVLAKQGRQEQAINSLEREIWAGDDRLLALRSYSAAIIEAKGADEAVAVLTALHSGNASDPVVALSLAELQVSQGLDATAALEASVAGYERSLRLFSQDAALWAGYGAAQQLSGKPKEATQASKKALKYDRREAVAYLTLAAQAEDSGDEAKATELREHAARGGVSNLSMAALLAAK